MKQLEMTTKLAEECRKYGIEDGLSAAVARRCWRWKLCVAG